MPEPVELDVPPEEVLDGLTVALTETGGRYTAAVQDDGILALTEDDGDEWRQETPREFDQLLCQGEFYIPEAPAWKVNEAIEQLAGGRDE